MKFDQDSNKLWQLLSMLLLIMFCCGCQPDTQSAKTNKEVIIDSVGRKVELNLPVKRAVVSNSHNIELIRNIGALDNIVGVDSGTYQDKEAYGDRFKPNQLIGKNQRELNFENIVELNPEVLIISGNGHWEDAAEKLKKFGIEVIVLNGYHSGEFQKNCELLGKIFGKEQQAQEFSTYFLDKINYIQKKLADKPRKTMYIEYRKEGSTIPPGRPYSKMVEYTCAKNIFDDADSPYINTEAVVMRNPEYIVKISELNVRGSYSPPTKEEFLRRKQAIVQRPGWDEIEAVKKDNILLLSHYAFGGASEIVGAIYVAKFLYPEYLPEINPEEIFRVWNNKYQGLDYIAGHTYPQNILEVGSYEGRN